MEIDRLISRGKPDGLMSTIRRLSMPVRGRIKRGEDLARTGVATTAASLPLGIVVDSRLAIAGAIIGVGIGLAGGIEANLSYTSQIVFRDPTAQSSPEIPLTEDVPAQISNQG